MEGGSGGGGSAVIQRIRDKVFVKPIIYGNTAQLLPKKVGDHTHRWTVYVKAYGDEDISKIVRKVQFRLHESYTNAVRVIEAPPFEVTETGWGEFEVQIKLFFQDVNEKSVTAYYYLRLHQPIVQVGGRQMVINEYYDEIVFREPTELVFRALQETKDPKPGRHHTDFERVRRDTSAQLANAQQEVAAEIQDLRESLKAAHVLINKWHAELEGGHDLSESPAPGAEEQNA
ncbi:CRE-GFL-1 protein [Aphelenchoides avenae]|nr:CRE-GFL-1 protein [Aphelenchus avenae]